MSDDSIVVTFTGDFNRVLRLASVKPCRFSPGYHQAESIFARRQVMYGHGDEIDDPADFDWPTHCACGYRFKDDDLHEIIDDCIYSRPNGDGKTEFVIKDERCRPSELVIALPKYEG